MEARSITARKAATSASTENKKMPLKEEKKESD